MHVGAPGARFNFSNSMAENSISRKLWFIGLLTIKGISLPGIRGLVLHLKKANIPIVVSRRNYVGFNSLSISPTPDFDNFYLRFATSNPASCSMDTFTNRRFYWWHWKFLTLEAYHLWSLSSISDPPHSKALFPCTCGMRSEPVGYPNDEYK